MSVSESRDEETLTVPAGVTITEVESNGKRVEILSGLKAGEKVWYSYYE